MIHVFLDPRYRHKLKALHAIGGQEHRHNTFFCSIAAHQKDRSWCVLHCIRALSYSSGGEQQTSRYNQRLHRFTSLLWVCTEFYHFLYAAFRTRSTVASGPLTDPATRLSFA